jgi:DNA-binding NarL/FixJ family response regulator
MATHGIELTEREMQVLRLSADGVGKTEIARELGVSPDRVKKIWASIKLNIGLDKGADVDDMVRRARSLRLI